VNGPARFALALAVGLLVAQVASGTEPDGDVRLTVERQAPGADGAERFRVIVDSAATLEQCTLAFGEPDGFSLSVAGSADDGDVAPAYRTNDGVAMFEWALGPLAARAQRVVEFRVVAPPGESARTDIVVTGRRADGRAVHGAAGVSLGRVVSRGTRRHGAIEFPAAAGTGDRP